MYGCVNLTAGLSSALFVPSASPVAEVNSTAQRACNPQNWLTAGPAQGFDQLFWGVQFHVPPSSMLGSLLEEAEWLHLREVVKGDERCSRWVRVSPVWLDILCIAFTNIGGFLDSGVIL